MNAVRAMWSRNLEASASMFFSLTLPLREILATEESST